eukprot:COSAG01_NODE_2890_length_6906_cov_23.470545_2_plen_86_part_00
MAVRVRAVRMGSQNIWKRRGISVSSCCESSRYLTAPASSQLLMLRTTRQTPPPQGMDVVKAIEAVGSQGGETSKPVMVKDCGVIE